MAFWDEIREKITQGSQEALQKTKDIADVVTINAEISDSKRKIRELYEELGELLGEEAFADVTKTAGKVREYFEEKVEPAVTEMADDVQAKAEHFAERMQEHVDELKEEAQDAAEASHEVVLRNWKEIYTKVRFIKSEKEVIELGESRINELRSETRCPGCGSKVVKGMSFCPECGRKLTEPEQAENMNFQKILRQGSFKASVQKNTLCRVDADLRHR